MEWGNYKMIKESIVLLPCEQFVSPFCKIEEFKNPVSLQVGKSNIVRLGESLSLHLGTSYFDSEHPIYPSD